MFVFFILNGCQYFSMDIYPIESTYGGELLIFYMIRNYGQLFTEISCGVTTSPIISLITKVYPVPLSNTSSSEAS